MPVPRRYPTIPQRRPTVVQPTGLFLSPSSPLARFASHGVVLSVAFGAALVTSHSFSLFSPQESAAAQFSLVGWPGPAPALARLDAERQHVQKPPVPVTQSGTVGATSGGGGTTAALKVEVYTVQPGDTLYGIASRFGVTTQTLVWANNLSSPDRLQVDMPLRVPPLSGVLHAVREGDTLSVIAEKYQTSLGDILAYKANGIGDPDALVLGHEIMVPGGVKPVEAPVSRLAAAPPRPSAAAPATLPQVVSPAPPPPPPEQAQTWLQWPTYGPIYGWYGPGHRGLDISPSYGSPVSAAAGGVVVWAQYTRDGYGYNILIDHGNGVSTLYAHLSEILVQAGQRVAGGQLVGRVGASGRTSGPHLHFEVQVNGVAINPLGVLPR